MKKNILLLSLEPITKEGSNGKSIGSLLSMILDDFDLTQIYIKNAEPNYLIGKYICLSENFLLKKLFKCKIPYEVREINSLGNCVYNSSSNRTLKQKKTAFKMLIRNFLWKISIHKFDNLFKKIKEINPDILIFQDCDIPFFCKLAVKIKNITNCSIIFYTSENYCFKRKNYMSSNFKTGLFYKFFKCKNFSAHKKMLKETFCSIFLTDSLKKEYLNHFEFIRNAYVIYPSSTFVRSDFDIKNKSKKCASVISYCGSLKVGRLDSLIKFAKIVQSFNYDIDIEVASNLSRNDADVLIDAQIKYLGFLKSFQVIDVISKSNFSLIVESFDKNISEDCKHAFTGKIADCLASNTPILYYGPKNNAICSFLCENRCAFICNSDDELRDFVEHKLFNNDLINEMMYNQKSTFDSYFSEEINSKLFRKCINKALEKYEKIN